jgi:protein-tyrosine-phosphatase
MTLGTAGRRVVAERFSSEHSGRALFAAYRSVALVSTLARRGASPPPPQEGAVDTQIGPAWFCYESARLFAKRAARKIRCWIAKREVGRLRRNPRPLLERVRRARTILMVCHGNIIRSPFAAELAKQALNGKRRVEIASAGLQAKPGNAVPPRALRMASGRRIDLASHTASPLTSELVATSDLILVMDIPQLVTLRQRFPDARNRTFLLTCLAPDTPLEVADPVDGDEGMFHRCFEHITRATRPVIRAIAAAHAE